MRRIVMACAGNICRSPLAEHLLVRELERRGIANVVVESCGLVAIDGDVPVERTLRAARAVGLDLASHRARRFHPAMLQGAELACAMERSQVDAIRATSTSSCRVVLLGSFGCEPPREVADPEEGSEDVFDACVAQIASHVAALADRLSD